jgi:hypothetical protein
MHVPNIGSRHLFPFIAARPSLQYERIVHLILYMLCWFFSSAPLTPNAGGEPRPKAEARHERKL